MRFLASIAFALGASTVAVANDISCHGSFWCGGSQPALRNDLIKQILDHIQGRDDNEEFGEHEYIDCVQKNMCAFFQEIGDDKKTIFDAKWGLQAVLDHNCDTCGSVPINPDSHDVYEGILKVDYFSDPL
ncbi:killer toxin Kp4/SMK [Aspergillus aurantiobrunneus]